MRLIIGLGNPGPQYAQTRHNAGFMALRRLAERHGPAGEPKSKFHAQVIEGQLAGERVMLMSPLTYMNRSGLAVGEAAAFYKVPASRVLVLVDDFALPLGAIRLRASGGPGGHNGLGDIERALGTDKYPRLRIGVGSPEVAGRPVSHVDHVLSSFTAEQQRELDGALDAAADAALCWLREGIDLAMTRFNKRGAEGPRDQGMGKPDSSVPGSAGPSH
jgi:peptidyl-tRNA hydrolase, PTH1 family